LSGEQDGFFNPTHILTGVMMNQIAIQKSKTKTPVRMLTMTALLAAISYVLAYIEIPVPLSPSFARMDLSAAANYGAKHA